ncbi:mannose-1-phosphate guanylyltransferase, partial [bacterium]|nr:mannose-1-phosphate guanylyltransferase [bacterium]
MPKVYYVIMAGGGGTRVWPVSTGDMPKQFRPFGQGPESMMLKTYDRLINIGASPEQIFISTRGSFVDQVEQLMPKGYPLENIIGEPAKKDTGPAMALCLTVLNHRFGADTTAVFLPSDHVIEDEQKFYEAVESAAKAAQNGKNMVTIGIKPRFASTALGYIEQGEETKLGPNINVVSSFVEKPEQKLAEEMFEQGGYVWNAALDVMNVSTALRALEIYAPELAARMIKIGSALGTDKEQAVIAEQYGDISEQSAKAFAYMISEGIEPGQEIKQVLVVGYFPWFDEGNFDAITEDPDELGNRVIGPNHGAVKLIDAKNNVVYAGENEKVTVDGLSDHVVVAQGGVVLVMPRSEAENLKQIVEILQADPDTKCYVDGVPGKPVTDSTQPNADYANNLFLGRGRVRGLFAFNSEVESHEGLVALFNVDGIKVEHRDGQVKVSRIQHKPYAGKPWGPRSRLMPDLNTRYQQTLVHEIADPEIRKLAEQRLEMLPQAKVVLPNGLIMGLDQYIIRRAIEIGRELGIEDIAEDPEKHISIILHGSMLSSQEPHNFDLQIYFKDLDIDSRPFAHPGLKLVFPQEVSPGKKIIDLDAWCCGEESKLRADVLQINYLASNGVFLFGDPSWQPILDDKMAFLIAEWQLGLAQLEYQRGRLDRSLQRIISANSFLVRFTPATQHSAWRAKAALIGQEGKLQAIEDGLQIIESTLLIVRERFPDLDQRYYLEEAGKLLEWAEGENNRAEFYGAMYRLGEVYLLLAGMGFRGCLDAAAELHKKYIDSNEIYLDRSKEITSAQAAEELRKVAFAYQQCRDKAARASKAEREPVRPISQRGVTAVTTLAALGTGLSLAGIYFGSAGLSGLMSLGLGWTAACGILGFIGAVVNPLMGIPFLIMGMHMWRTRSVPALETLTENQKAQLLDGWEATEIMDMSTVADAKKEIAYFDESSGKIVANLARLSQLPRFIQRLILTHEQAHLKQAQQYVESGRAPPGKLAGEFYAYQAQMKYIFSQTLGLFLDLNASQKFIVIIGLHVTYLGLLAFLLPAILPAPALAVLAGGLVIIAMPVARNTLFFGKKDPSPETPKLTAAYLRTKGIVITKENAHIVTRFAQLDIDELKAENILSRLHAALDNNDAAYREIRSYFDKFHRRGHLDGIKAVNASQALSMALTAHLNLIKKNPGMVNYHRMEKIVDLLADPDHDIRALAFNNLVAMAAVMDQRLGASRILDDAGIEKILIHNQAHFFLDGQYDIPRGIDKPDQLAFTALQSISRIADNEGVDKLTHLLLKRMAQMHTLDVAPLLKVDFQEIFDTSPTKEDITAWTKKAVEGGYTRADWIREMQVAQDEMQADQKEYQAAVNAIARGKFKITPAMDE